MITGTSLVALLHGLATGHADRALNVVVSEPDLGEGLRQVMYAAVSENVEPADQARAVGDALRDADSDPSLANECYRLAFYLSDAWAELAGNPLYAHFSANRAARVLDKWVHYFPIYTRHLERFRARAVKVLEIGVYRGGGLELLAGYLGPQAKLVGLDIDEDAVRAVRGRFPVVLGDQADPDVLRKINDEHGPFDVIIDDGGHTMEQQIATIETLFPLLNDDGIFVVEDTHTSYWSEFGGGLYAPESFVEWAKPRVDDLHSRHHVGIDRNSIWATDLDGMHWYDSVVVLDKKRRFRPFNEVAGTASYLGAARFSETLVIEMLATRDQALHERDVLRQQVADLQRDEADVAKVDRLTTAWATQEELRLARAELANARAQLAGLGAALSEREDELTSTRNDLFGSWEQIRLIRKTSSWRVTKPLRAVRRLLSR
ncbi:MAG: class I SAM-dependent methyltransferase [Jatrophihabitantaceae bacterium]